MSTDHEMPMPATEAWATLVSGLQRFVQSTPCADVVLGLSGGIDSAVVACLAVEALGPEHVQAITMPSRYTSIANLGDAMELASRLRITARNIPIGPPHPGVLDTPQIPFLETFEEGLKDCGYKVEGVTLENLQARIRAVILMAHANARNALVLNTGNKSEAMMGYCTLYGDSIGAVAPIGNVYKTDVYRLARYYNKTRLEAQIPQNILDKPPSAELRPGQRDDDDLPPYDQLDTFLRRVARGEVDVATTSGAENAWLHRIQASQFKRDQAPFALFAPDTVAEP